MRIPIGYALQDTIWFFPQHAAFEMNYSYWIKCIGSLGVRIMNTLSSGRIWPNLTEINKSILISIYTNLINQILIQ